MLLPVSHAGSVVDYPQSECDASTSEVFIYVCFFVSYILHSFFSILDIKIGDSSSGFPPK